MPAAEAASRFAILSIGDAMVSQIPSLLISVAAGVLITRVNDEHAKRPKSLGDEISSQLSASPRALYTAAALLLGFAAVPGFPWMVFLVLAGGLAAGAFALSKNRGAAAGGTEHNGLQREGAKGDNRGIEAQAAAFSCPLAITLSKALGKALRTDALNAAFERERVGLQDELGLPFPGIRLWTREALGEHDYQVLVHDVPSANGSVTVDVNEGMGAMVGTATDGDAARQTLSPEERIAQHAVAVLRDNAHQFVGIQEVQWVMERVAKDYPGLVTEVQKVLPMQRISDVLKRLLEEHISIRNMRTIFESLIVWGPKEKDVVMLTEYVRGDLGRYLTHRATGGAASLNVVLLDAQVEKLIRESIKPTPAGNFLAMAPDNMSKIAQHIVDIAGELPQAGIAIVTPMDIRRYVRRIIEARLKWLNVYSFQELNGQVTLEPVGRVTL
jgi:type III secretion protein V